MEPRKGEEKDVEPENEEAGNRARKGGTEGAEEGGTEGGGGREGKDTGGAGGRTAESRREEPEEKSRARSGTR